MSLTREEWEDLWKAIKSIERDSDYLWFNRRNVSQRIKNNCAIIKTYVQQVIGQME